MKERTNQDLIEVAIRITMAGAREYLKAHKLTADMTALAECCRSWMKIQLPVALADAKEALDANMGQVAEATFKASMFQAGIEAAKECCQRG